MPADAYNMVKEVGITQPSFNTQESIMSDTQTNTNTTATASAAASKPAKAPSKKSLATAIFNSALARRAAGEFASNRDFRAEVLKKMREDLGVSVASAATMYNTAKIEAEAADPTLALGRDPKVAKPAKKAATSNTVVVDTTAPAESDNTGTTADTQPDAETV